MKGTVEKLEPLCTSHLGTFVHRVTLEDTEETYALHTNWFVNNTLEPGDQVEYTPSLNSVMDDYGKQVYWFNKIRVTTEIKQDDETQVEVQPDL